MNLKRRKIRLTVAITAACLIGFLGYVGFLQGIHAPIPVSKIMFAVGLPLLEVAINTDWPFVAIAGSIVAWTAAIYAIITLVLALKRGNNTQ